MREVELQPYSDQWPLKYECEALVLKQLMGANFIASYHIGSTAIKGIRAKPTIDILVEINDLTAIDELAREFEVYGYNSLGEYGISGRRFLYKGGDGRNYHVHIYETGNPEIQRHVLFVQFLTRHPDRAADYERLKKRLAELYKTSPEKYSEQKSDFIKDVDIEALAWYHHECLD